MLKKYKTPDISRKNFDIHSSYNDFKRSIEKFYNRFITIFDIKIFDEFHEIQHFSKKNKAALNDNYYSNENIYFIFFSIALIAKLAQSDSRVNALEERSLINEFSKLGYALPDIKKLFIDAINDKHESNFYISKIKLIYGNKKESYENLIRSMIIIAESDGPVNKQEMNFIKNASSLFGFDEKVLLKIFFAALTPTFSKNPYKILKISRNITKAELTQVYRNIAKKYHPDNYIKLDHIAEEYKVILQNKFDIYTKAYLYLKNKLIV